MSFFWAPKNAFIPATHGKPGAEENPCIINSQGMTNFPHPPSHNEVRAGGKTKRGGKGSSLEPKWIHVLHFVSYSSIPPPSIRGHLDC